MMMMIYRIEKEGERKSEGGVVCGDGYARRVEWAATM